MLSRLIIVKIPLVKKFYLKEKHAFHPLVWLCQSEVSTIKFYHLYSISLPSQEELISTYLALLHSKRYKMNSVYIKT